MMHAPPAPPWSEDIAERFTRLEFAGARSGDHEAIRILYERHAPHVRRYLRGVVGAAEAEDLTQQVFLKLLTAIHRYQPRDEVPFVRWLLRVARNLAIDHLRGARAVPSENVVHMVVGADEAGWERARSLREALAELPQVQREVLVLRHVAGLSPVEIATLTGRSEHSVHGLHHRGRGALKRELIRRQAAPATLTVELRRAA
jgi:RNA polymerase sigma-70 factor (ECF subfamily)